MNQTEKIRSYCEVGFLNSLFNEIVHPTDEKFQKIYEYFLLFKDRCQLIIDSYEELLKCLDNPYIKSIIKHSNTGGSEIVKHRRFFEDLDVDFDETVRKGDLVNPLFFFARPKTHMRNYGVEMTSYGHHLNTIYKVALNTFSLNVSRTRKLSNQLETWEDLLGELPACNSLVIADNYLLHDENYDRSLFAILNIILPSELEIPFDLTIIAKRDMLYYERKVQLIQDFVEKLPITVNITITQFNYHDRALITNYAYIQSGHSFSFFNKKGDIAKDALVTCKLICSENNHEWFINQLRTLNNAVKRGLKTIGNGRNRLLDAYEE